MFIVIVFGVLLIIGIAYVYKKVKAFKAIPEYQAREEAWEAKEKANRAVEATPEWKTLNEVEKAYNEAWDALYATPAYEAYLKADEVVKATPEYKDWEKAYEARKEVKEAYRKEIKAKYEAMEEEAW